MKPYSLGGPGDSVGHSKAMALAVILDMDGLMLDTEPIALSAWKQASCDLGHELDDVVCDRLNRAQPSGFQGTTQTAFW